jgi:nucleotide-binding universal stress UspA family protein
LNTVFAVVPAAPAAGAAVAAFRALPTGTNAKLVGMHVSPVGVSIGLVTDIAISSYIEAQAEAAAKERDAAREAFSKACEQAGIVFEWRSTQSLDAVVSAQAGACARAADLVLCPTLAEQASLGRHRLEELVFASGRPVVGLPSNWSGPSLGKRVLIAWDGGREATRAAFDALPLLSRADEVRLVSVNGFQRDPVRQFTPGDDIAATLSRHGIPVESLSVESTRRSAAEELQAQALDFGADLLVMGCYGRSRLRERILGGVSRDMLAEVPFPLLLSN